MSTYVIGISGGSGAPYAKRVLQGLLAAGHDVKCVITGAGRQVLEIEEGVGLTGIPGVDQPILRAWAGAALPSPSVPLPSPWQGEGKGVGRKSDRASARPSPSVGPGRKSQVMRSPALGHGSLDLLDESDVAAPIASGSYPVAGMAVIPCSTGTLARIAHGISSGLLERAADVCLKERRRLILVPRETPLSLIHIRNMAAVTEAGAIVLPAMPGFYHHPKSVQDLVDFIAGRVLAHLGVEASFLKKWTGPVPDALEEPDRIETERTQ